MNLDNEGKKSKEFSYYHYDDIQEKPGQDLPLQVP